MSRKQMFEATLLLSGAALGATGAVLIEPILIGVGVVAAGAAAVMRYQEHKSDLLRSMSQDVHTAT